MIAGTHITLYSKDAEADRQFFKNVLQIPSVDAGGGWLIFASKRSTSGFSSLPRDDAKETVKETKETVKKDTNDVPEIKAEFMFSVDDIDEFRKALKERGNVDLLDDPVKNPWGIVGEFILPSGGSKIQVYQPLHPMVVDGEGDITRIAGSRVSQTMTEKVPAEEEEMKNKRESDVEELDSSKRVKVA